ncbi:MAG: prephenate dehydrogenase/arogenate dehydrogenase family protein [candidate division WOR-3 bacterium]|nr:prephenate dehydrogenase/arogenate dehydrogenase family protein [candidate division WOR-3 bacterium]
MDRLNDLRKNIKKIDCEILDLIKKRIELSKEIGRLKKKAGIPLRDWSVEKDVIGNAINHAGRRGLDVNFTRMLITRIIEHSRFQQERLHYSAYGGKKEDILIIGGLGAMGKWFAYFFQNQGHRVAIQDIKPEGIKGFKYYRDIKSSLDKKSIVIITTPLQTVPEIIFNLTELNYRGIIADIASVKSHMIKAIKEAIKNKMKITSIHPMFGPACHTLNDKVICICDCGCPEANEKISGFFKDTAVSLINLSFEEHDRIISYILGLSHLINILFIKNLMDSGYSFKELTKVASTTFSAQMETAKSVINENPELYFEIQSLNPYSCRLYHHLRESLDHLIDLIQGGARDDFIKLFQKGAQYLDEDEY